MASLPGTKSDVFFGLTDELPDWRKEPLNLDDDSITLEEEGIPSAGLIAQLGFDPRELCKRVAAREAAKAKCEAAAKQQK